MSKFGFKEITVENCLKPDDLFSSFWKNNEENKFIPMSGEEWVEIVLENQLSKTVPLEVQKLFKVAKGAYVYGFFFYPLHTLGAEQIFRVVETDISFKCKSLNAPKSRFIFLRKLIGFLKTNIFLI